MRLFLILLVSVLPLQADFDELDATLAESAQYVARHEARIDAVKKVLYGRDQSAATRYEAYGRLFELYYPYQFDHALDALNNR